MAFVKSDGGATPHATDYSDLLDILVAFAVGTGDWEITDDELAGNGFIILKGLDYTGDKAIYVGIKKYADVLNDIYGWILQGYTGFTGAGFMLEPGAITGVLPVLPLWNDDIPYWLSVNPRRILLVANVSGVYVAMYLGLMLPYGSTGQWQYPLVIGGSNISNGAGTTVPRYSDNSASMTVPFIPAGGASNSNLLVRSAAGQWVRLFNSTDTVTINAGSFTTAHGISPYNSTFWTQCRANIDGDYPLRALRPMRGNTPDALGILDGAKFVPGHLLSSEDTITEGSDDYTVFQNTFRTSLFNFFAIQES